MISKTELLPLVVELAMEVANEAQWMLPDTINKSSYELIASSMVEIHLGDHANYAIDATTISLLASIVFLSVQNMMLFKLVLSEDGGG